MKNSKVLSLFVFSFFAPLLLAFVLLKVDWSPTQQVNNGHFLAQQITLENWQKIQPKQWSIVQQSTSECLQTCQYTQQQMQQVFNALGKYKDKVGLVFLGEPQQFSGLKNFPSTHQSLKVNTLYLVDRFGLIVLAYPLSENEQTNRSIKQGLIKDLKKLFKFSRSA